MFFKPLHGDKESPCAIETMMALIFNKDGVTLLDRQVINTINDFLFRQKGEETTGLVVSDHVCIEPFGIEICRNDERQSMSHVDKQTMSADYFKSRAEEYLQSAFYWYECHKRYFKCRLPTRHYATGEIFRMTQSDALRPFLFKEKMRHVYNLSEKNLDYIIEETNHVYSADAENEVMGHMEMTCSSSSGTAETLTTFSPINNIHMNNMKKVDFIQSQQSVFPVSAFYTCYTSCGANAVKYVIPQAAAPESRDDVFKKMHETCDRLNGIMDNYDRSKRPKAVYGFKYVVEDRGCIKDAAVSICKILEDCKWISVDEENVSIMTELLRGNPVHKKLRWIASAPKLCHLLRVLTGKTKAGYKANMPLVVIKDGEPGEYGIWEAACACFCKQDGSPFVPKVLSGTRPLPRCNATLSKRNKVIDEIAKVIYKQLHDNMTKDTDNK